MRYQRCQSMLSQSQSMLKIEYTGNTLHQNLHIIIPNLNIIEIK